MDSRLVQFPVGIDSKEVKLLVFDVTVLEFVMELGVIDDLVSETPFKVNDRGMLFAEDRATGAHSVTMLVELAGA